MSLVVLSFSLCANDYELGHGYKVNDSLHIGGYFSTDYTFTNNNNQFELDDVAILAYGNLTPQFSYFFELEAAPFYTKNFSENLSQTNTKFHYERVYLDYSHSEILNVRVGKQITPIGYWNLEPINVLRDTSSNPLYSFKMFPKLLTGIDLYGYLDDKNTLNYHLFVQKNNDLDEDYINIKNDSFIGLTLNYEWDEYLDFGTSLGQYKTKETDDTVNFIQLNARFNVYPWLIQTEFAYNDIDNTLTNDTSYQLSGYVQGKYDITQKHALISRYEYYKDSKFDTTNQIAIFGYSYRPQYSISIKAEYQIHSESTHDKAILSFSVLF